MASYKELYDYYAANVDKNGINTNAWNDRFNQWTMDVGSALGLEPGNWDAIPVGELGNFEYQGGDNGPTPGATVPLEQGLLQQALPGLMDDVAGDSQRALMAQAMNAQNQGDYDLARQLIERATSGQQLTGELNMAGQTAQERQAALDAAIAKMRAAQTGVSTARLGEAESGVTGVNLGLERALDQLDAQRAEQGFVGGSTADLNAATRATVGARQQAAGLVGAAKTANATDERGIGAYDASQGYSIADALAQQKQGLYNADYGRSLQAALSLPGITNQYLQTQNAIDSQRNAGLLRTQQALNWWAAPASAPTAGTTPVTASNSGNDLAGLGANLTGAAISIGNANKWWQTPNTNNTPATSSPTGYYTPGGNAGVQTDWSQAFAA